MTLFQIGDTAKVNEDLDLLPSLEKFRGQVGYIFHVEPVTSPYTGTTSQLLGIRFPNHIRHITENGSWFVAVLR